MDGLQGWRINTALHWTDLQWTEVSLTGGKHKNTSLLCIESWTKDSWQFHRLKSSRRRALKSSSAWVHFALHPTLLSLKICCHTFPGPFIQHFLMKLKSASQQYLSHFPINRANKLYDYKVSWFDFTQLWNFNESVSSEQCKQFKINLYKCYKVLRTLKEDTLIWVSECIRKETLKK